MRCIFLLRHKDVTGVMKVDFVLVLTRHTGNTNVDATNAPPTPSVCVAMEDTLLAQGIAVVRILQEDVYFDRHNWRTWITKAVAKAEADAEAGAPPRVHLPWRDEYRASVYRDSARTAPQVCTRGRRTRVFQTFPFTEP